YAAYYYYRAKGWVVRSGIKFGTDFLLYGRGGPARSHSQYSVVVRRLSGDADDGEELPHEQPHLSRSWQYMAALSRVCTQTRKSLIMCSVRPPPPPGEMPDAAGDTGLSLPPDLSQYEIQEVLVERFDANAK
ncbi:tRNA splicing endonuclease subunit sen2, partial [Coemansia biformis]